MVLVVVLAGRAAAVQCAAHIVCRAGQTLSYRHPVFAASHTVFSWPTSGIKFPVKPIPKTRLLTLENRRSRTLPIIPKTGLNPLPALPFPEPCAHAKCSSSCIGVWGAAAADRLQTGLSKSAFVGYRRSQFHRAVLSGVFMNGTQNSTWQNFSIHQT